MKLLLFFYHKAHYFECEFFCIFGNNIKSKKNISRFSKKKKKKLKFLKK